MKQVILDTNFILSCIRKKIDFFEEIKFMGLEIIIPKEVIKEIEKFRQKPESEVALKLIKKNNYNEIELGKGHVDKKIINYAKNSSEIIVATLDREIKNKVNNRKLIIRGKRLEIF
jgi:rRNA-processing protein FCF1